MVKYSVAIKETLADSIVVEAETKEEAIQKVLQMITDRNNPFLFDIESIKSDRFEPFLVDRNLHVMNGFRVRYTDSEGSESIEEWGKEEQAEQRIKDEVEAYGFADSKYDAETKTTIAYNEVTGLLAKWQRLW